MNSQYLAGLFDGEGCIGLYAQNRWKTYSLYVTIGMTDPQAILALAKLYPEGKFGKYNDLYRVSFFGHKSQRFLEDILPHSLVKTKQVADALEYLDLANAAPKRNRPLEFHTRCLELVDSIKKTKSENRISGEE